MKSHSSTLSELLKQGVNVINKCTQMVPYKSRDSF